jgi:hypothetical protein
MIAFSESASCEAPNWHDRFLAMLPAILPRVRMAFRHLPPEARQDAVAEATAHALCAFVRLVELHKTELAYPTVLARYGIAQFRVGRRVGTSLNCNDVLSDYARRRQGFAVERLDHFDDGEIQWTDAVVQDTRTAPVPDIVCFRLDFAAWLQRLPIRNRRIAESLAIGHRTKDVSRRCKVSAGRIAQLRRKLADSWVAFRGEDEATGRIDPVVA